MEEKAPEDRSGGETGAQNDERRREPRCACAGFAEALVIRPEALFRGEIRDLSSGGCFIQTRAQVHVELSAAVDLRFILRHSQCHFEAAIAHVRDGGGYGLVFRRAADPQSAEALEDLIRMLRQEAGE